MFRNLFKKKEGKKIPENTYRVIKISKDALYEFICESFLDHQGRFLDITDTTAVVYACGVDWEEDAFTFIARNAKGDDDFFEEIDFQKIAKAISDTTSTMYAGGRYVDFSQAQIDDMQKD